MKDHTNDQQGQNLKLQASSRRIFISFLGTSRYKRCLFQNPRRNGEECETPYIQEALIKFFFVGNSTSNDRILIFMTDEARKKNWEDNETEGLRSRIGKLGFANITETIKIPAGKNKEELWQIFNIIYSKLQESDRIILDITHGFRYQPMLMLILLNYARFLKNIEIERVYYGALEAQDNNDIIEKITPVFDLTEFVTLLHWTSAVQEFTLNGNATEIANLLSKEHDGKSTGYIKNVSNYLILISSQISTCRGLDIISAESFIELRKFLENKTISTQLPLPLNPLLDKIIKKIENFKKNNDLNFLTAARWCEKHNLIQQGITILLEGIVSFFAKRHNLDPINQKERGIVSDVLPNYYKIEKYGIVAQEAKKSTPNSFATGNPQKAQEIFNDVLFTKELSKYYHKLSEARNDINHAGIRRAPSKALSISKQFSQALSFFESFFAKQKE